MKFKIVELSHSDLKSFFYYALSYFHISWASNVDTLMQYILFGEVIYT